MMINIQFGFSKQSLTTIALAIFLAPLAAAANEVSYDDPTTDFVTDHGIDEFGGSPDCDVTCKQIIVAANSICDQHGQSSPNCVHAKADQLFYQCMAYDQAGWTAFFDTYMIVLDAAAGGTCTYACVMMTTGNVIAGGSAETLCNAVAALDAAGDAADIIALNKLLGNYWAGTTTLDQINTALAIAGIL